MQFPHKLYEVTCRNLYHSNSMHCWMLLLQSEHLWSCLLCRMLLLDRSIGRQCWNLCGMLLLDAGCGRWHFCCSLLLADCTGCRLLCCNLGSLHSCLLLPFCC